MTYNVRLDTEEYNFDVSVLEIDGSYKLSVEKNSIFYDRIDLIIIDQDGDLLVSFSHGKRNFDVTFIVKFLSQAEYLRDEIEKETGLN